MNGSILIENLRNISRLEFDMPSPGVWILTAGNGAGKTSLLACIRRIGHSNAFPIHFPVSYESEYLDNYKPANITYSINGEIVEYAYRGERWAPRPRANSHLLRQFGYPQVLYVGATADRITPRPEDFVLRRVRIANPTLRKDMNAIFETDKFDNLYTINIAPGSGSEVFILKTGVKEYHSEKQFSLGELCVLKLLRSISDCPNQSLLLIDELEIALHPRAQIQLFNHLRRAAKQKRLTVIFSTHSVILLKFAPTSCIIYLERDILGVVTPVIGCFPAYAIGRITLGEEASPDVVFYVEDDAARNILYPLSKLVMQHKYKDSLSLFPTLKVVPIGPFASVVKFLTHHGALLPPETSSYAILDQDVQTETVEKWKAHENFSQLTRFKNLEQKIDYLPWTPEVALVEMFKANRSLIEGRLRHLFDAPSIVLQKSTFDKLIGLEKKSLRDAAKKIYVEICEQASEKSALSVEHAEDKICELFAVEYFKINKAKVLGLLGPKL